MLFNSQFFVFVFLPASLAVYFALGRISRSWALSWIIVASLIFYAWWRPANVFIILPALLLNFGIARLIEYSQQQEKNSAARIWLTLGIAFNIVFLGYFKYANFAITATNDLFGTQFTLTQIILPLGISFITFQKIAFLIDVYGRRVGSFKFREFCSFILFFPQLIAGPIVHFREMMPQFRNATCRWSSENVAVGLTLFVFGLFKKVAIADNIAPMVSSIYASAGTDAAISLIPAWLAAIGFTFQIYFDFSGYTDMALGAARLFGIRLPVNFNSPLKSSSIIDFWLRWHVSLTRFLTAYVYNPIALAVTRRRLHSGKPGVGGRNTSPGAFLQLLLLPTVFTMFISGLWHGAGYMFIVWGLLHGVYLSINHAWRVFVGVRWSDSQRYKRVMRPVGFLLTFVAVALSMVFFRSTSLDMAMNIANGMVGINGIQLPTAIYERLLQLAGWLGNFGISGELANFANIRSLTIWLVALAPVVFLAPNTLQILRDNQPAEDLNAHISPEDMPGRLPRWSMSARWTVAVAILAWIAVANIGGYSEFLYWQF